MKSNRLIFCVIAFVSSPLSARTNESSPFAIVNVSLILSPSVTRAPVVAFNVD